MKCAILLPQRTCGNRETVSTADKNLSMRMLYYVAPGRGVL